MRYLSFSPHSLRFSIAFHFNPRLQNFAFALAHHNLIQNHRRIQTVVLVGSMQRAFTSIFSCIFPLPHYSCRRQQRLSVLQTTAWWNNSTFTITVTVTFHWHRPIQMLQQNCVPSQLNKTRRISSTKEKYLRGMSGSLVYRDLGRMREKVRGKDERNQFKLGRTMKQLYIYL